MAYEPHGALKSLTYGNGLTLAQDWGVEARLGSKAVRRADGTVVWGASYAYDAEDNVTGVTDLADATRSFAYEYDAASRLSRATGTYGSVRRYDYQFDLNGNRTREETRATVGQAVPSTATDHVRVAGTNRLGSTGVRAGLRTFAYDNRGNLAGETRLDADRRRRRPPPRVPQNQVRTPITRPAPPTLSPSARAKRALSPSLRS
jgi:YD repeat-containing protein